jgi:hypothetical protein
VKIVAAIVIGIAALVLAGTSVQLRSRSDTRLNRNLLYVLSGITVACELLILASFAFRA